MSEQAAQGGRTEDVTLSLTVPDAEKLRRLASSQGLTDEQALRKALALDLKLVDEHAHGNRILIQRGRKYIEINPSTSS